MSSSPLTLPKPLSDRLASLVSGRAPGDLEPWRGLVVSALRRARVAVTRDDDLVDDVLASVLERLLRLYRRGGPAWRLLMLLEEPRLRAALARMAVRAAMDLDPDRGRKRALAQLVGRVLAEGGSVEPSAPLSLRDGDRLCRGAVGAAVAWALRQEDGPPRRPYAIACWLLRTYEPTDRLDGEERWLADDDQSSPDRRAEQAEHARRVATGLAARLATDESRVLSLRLQGETLEEVAQALECKRTKAQGLAARARAEVDRLVAEIEAEWLAA